MDNRRVLAELARAQRGAGLSDADVGRACRMSRWTVARIVGGRRSASIVELAAIGAAVGLDVRLQAYLAGDPVRDAGQRRVLDRLRTVLHPSLHMRTEVALPVDGDRRAWDAVISGGGWRAAIEVETVIDDIQALERRLNLKTRDGGVDRVILVIAATQRNRRTLAGAGSAFGWLSRDARATLGALRAGVAPPESAIVLL